MSKVIFAGAGTAGHVEPALAVARWFRDQHPEIECAFLGTPEGVENSLVPAAGFPLTLIRKSPFPRRINLELLSWPLRFWRTLRETKVLLGDVDLVIGFGGYVAAPAYLAARRAGIPILAHEANAKMGMANRLGVWCGATLLRGFAFRDQQAVGIPLRKSIIDLASLTSEERTNAKKQARLAFNLNPEKRTILVFGGSLGSAKFNETVAQAQKDISELGFQLIHAVGAKNQLPQAQVGYVPLSYIDDMASAYAAADLVISRSGAVTVVETGVLGIFTVYVPLPIGNGEQAHNAQEVVARGGGELIPNAQFTSQWLGGNISRLMTQAQSWSSAHSRIDFPLNASEEIATHILKVLTHD